MWVWKIALRKQVPEESASNGDCTHSMNSSWIRLFDAPTLNLEANAYYELANVVSYQQKPPAIASLTDTEIEEYLKKPLVLHQPCHKQSVERHVKLATKLSAQVAGFERWDGVICQKKKFRKLMKTFDTKKQFKWSILVNHNYCVTSVDGSKLISTCSLLRCCYCYIVNMLLLWFYFDDFFLWYVSRNLKQ